MATNTSLNLVQGNVSIVVLCISYPNDLYNSIWCWYQTCVCSNLCCIQIRHSTLQYAEGAVVKVMMWYPVQSIIFNHWWCLPHSLLYNLAQEDDLMFWDVLKKFVKKLFLIPVPPPGRLCIVSYWIISAVVYMCLSVCMYVCPSVCLSVWVISILTSHFPRSPACWAIWIVCWCELGHH